jgi:hypothetical protein
MMIRALYRAVKVSGAAAPFDTLLAKVFYPAAFAGDAAERNLGVVPADGTRAPFPVVIFLNGVNGPPETYQWLLEALAARGCVAVSFAWVTDTLPGGVPGLTPGVDLASLRPENYGSAPTCPAIEPLLQDLAEMNANGPLAGLLDLSRVALGGHSAGGSAALVNANPRFFPNIRAGFAYGAHTQAATALGHAPGSVLRLSDDLPLLVLGGNRDGVIAASGGRYRAEGVVESEDTQREDIAELAVAPLLHTFEKALGGARGDRFLAILDGANHFSLAHPQDMTTGRPYLDRPATRPGEEIRALLLELIGAFVGAYLRDDAAAACALRERAADERLPLFMRK